MTSQVAGGQANFRGKYTFFQLLSSIKVYLVAKIMQSAFLCVIFHVKRKKIPSSCGFNLILKFLVIFKMATIVGDVTGLQQRHHP